MIGSLTITPDDIFLARMDPAAGAEDQVPYCTYLGGPDGDVVNAMVIDPSGAIWVGGSSSMASTTIPVSGVPESPATTGFPLVRTLQDFGGGYSDGIVVRIDPGRPGAEALTFATYLGGNGFRQGFAVPAFNWFLPTLDDTVAAIAADPAGGVYVVGSTSAANFPTKNALQPENRGRIAGDTAQEGFLAHIVPD